MEEYPLQVSIPRTEKTRGTQRSWRVRGSCYRFHNPFAHTSYSIELDDCGRVYTRHRRYANFCWLHGELRRRELRCTLPELPPKRVVGNMDSMFVEGRRQLLEDYLRALLRLPAVMLDDTIWAFLDADMATAVVPRFLCRPQSHVASAESLVQLDTIVAKERDMFRLCTPAVLKEFMNLAKADACEAQAARSVDRSSSIESERSSQIPYGRSVRLDNRLRFCRVLQMLMNHERARQWLVDHDMFGALLTLLSHTTEECEEVRRSGKEPCDKHKKAHFAVTDGLHRLLEYSRGGALLHFCQQGDGLGMLRRLASGTESLHPLTASLLWHGLQNTLVANILVNSNGLPLLGKLLVSPDLRSRVLAALCIGCIVRQEESLSAEDQEHCQKALVEMGRVLDEAESAALERTAAAVLDTSMLASSSSRVDGFCEESFNSSESFPVAGCTTELSSMARAGVRSAWIDRDQSLVALLHTLCSPRELPRLSALLGKAGTGDSVTSFILVLLDHFVQQSSADPTKLQGLHGLVGRLQGFLTADAGTDAQRDEASCALFEDIRMRAARILIHLDWPANVETAGGPPRITAMGQRTQMLGVIVKHLAVCQDQAQKRLVNSQRHGRLQGDRIKEAGLTSALSLGEAEVIEFSRHVAALDEQRSLLGCDVVAQGALQEGMYASLKRRGTNQGLLNRNVHELREYIGEQSLQERRSTEAQQVVAACEAACSATTADVEAKTASKRGAEAALHEMTRRQQAEESRATELAQREADLADALRDAPAQVERVQVQLEECEHRRGELAELRRRLDLEVERGGARAATLKEWIGEAERAMQSLAGVKRQLQVIQGALSAEVVPADVHVEELRQLGLKLIPERPERLRPASVEEDADRAAGFTMPAVNLFCAPTWDDRGAEQEFQSSPDFKSLSKLCSQRERLWNLELSWLQSQLQQANVAMSDLQLQLSLQEQQEHRVAGREEELHAEQAALSDFEGHTARLKEACVAAADARQRAQHAAGETLKAVQISHREDAPLEMSWSEQRKAEEALTTARDKLRAEEGCMLQVRSELCKRVKALERNQRAHMEEWRSAEVDERGLALLQTRVASKLHDEEVARVALQEKAQQLVYRLHDLDSQLNPEASAPCRPRQSLVQKFLHRSL